jgi:hypothetical protein
MPTFRPLEAFAFHIRIESIAFHRKFEEPGGERIQIRIDSIAFQIRIEEPGGKRIGGRGGGAL